jgi:hypothetical protein
VRHSATPNNLIMANINVRSCERRRYPTYRSVHFVSGSDVVMRIISQIGKSNVIASNNFVRTWPMLARLIIGYVDDFKLMMVLTLAVIALLLLLRGASPADSGEQAMAME